MKAVSLLILCTALAAFAFGVHGQSRAAAKTGPAKPDAARPEVVVIDQAGLAKAVKADGKPLLVNFWATWCDPCREEFPDLVKIDADYRDRVHLITISLDDISDLKSGVPKFLAQMKADMPAYLLQVPDEGAAIASVYEQWSGGLPFTILFDKDGKIAYSRQGKFVTRTLRGELDKLLVEKTNP